MKKVLFFIGILIFTHSLSMQADDVVSDLDGNDEIDYSHSDDWQVAETELDEEINHQNTVSRKYGDLPPDYPMPDESEFEE